MSRQWNGDPQSPIKLRTNRQTEESPRYHQPRTPRVAEDENPDAWEEPRPHTSAVRYDTPRRRETTHLPPAKATKVIHYRRFSLARVLVICGLSMIVLLLGIMALSWLGNWWTTQTNDWTYGRPRTFQTEEYVGHGDTPDHPNHFIAVNLKGVVEVVEINTQNAQFDHIYYITTTSDPLNPVTLSFPTVDGKQLMYVNIGSTNPYTVALVNNGKAFVGVQH
jgi:hypothetical protein